MLEKDKNKENKKLIPLRRFTEDGPYSKTYLSLLVQRKKLKARKVGRNYFTTREWFNEYLENHARDGKRQVAKKQEETNLVSSTQDKLKSKKEYLVDDSKIIQADPIREQIDIDSLAAAITEKVLSAQARVKNESSTPADKSTEVFSPKDNILEKKIEPAIEETLDSSAPSNTATATGGASGQEEVDPLEIKTEDEASALTSALERIDPEDKLRSDWKKEFKQAKKKTAKLFQSDIKNKARREEFKKVLANRKKVVRQGKIFVQGIYNFVKDVFALTIKIAKTSKVILFGIIAKLAYSFKAMEELSSKILGLGFFIFRNLRLRLVILFTALIKASNKAKLVLAKAATSIPNKKNLPKGFSLAPWQTKLTTACLIAILTATSFSYFIPRVAAQFTSSLDKIISKPIKEIGQALQSGGQAIASIPVVGQLTSQTIESLSEKTIDTVTRLEKNIKDRNKVLARRLGKVKNEFTFVGSFWGGVYQNELRMPLKFIPKKLISFSRDGLNLVKSFSRDVILEPKEIKYHNLVVELPSGLSINKDSEIGQVAGVSEPPLSAEDIDLDSTAGKINPAINKLALLADITANRADQVIDAIKHGVDRSLQTLAQGQRKLSLVLGQKIAKFTRDSAGQVKGVSETGSDTLISLGNTIEATNNEIKDYSADGQESLSQELGRSVASLSNLYTRMIDFIIPNSLKRHYAQLYKTDVQIVGQAPIASPSETIIIREVPAQVGTGIEAKTVGGVFSVNGNAQINNKLTVLGPADLIGGIYNSQGNVIIDDNLEVKQSLTTKNLIVTDLFDFQGSVTLDYLKANEVVVMKKLNVVGDGVVQGSLSIGENLEVVGTFSTGHAQFSSLGVSSFLSGYSVSAGAGGFSASGDAYFSGDTSFAGDNVFITSAVDLDSILDIDTDSTTALAVGDGSTNTFVVNTTDNIVAIASDAYLNWGSADGDSGYGLKDSSGTLQYKNSGGSWADIGSGGGSWTSIGNDIYYNTGNVGIGTSSPHSRLSVWGDGTNPIFEVLDNASSTKMIILNSGNVGIGTSSPNHSLDINGNIGLKESQYINWGYTDGDSGYGLKDSSGTLQYKNLGGSWADIGSGGGGAGTLNYGEQYSLAYYATAGTTATGTPASSLTFTGTNLGVGTTSPWGLLSVNAPGGANPFVIGSSTGTQFIIKESGNVGIGTTSPYQLLSVNGTSTMTAIGVGGGTASAPAIYFNDDSNTGIYSSGANVLNMSVGGYTRFSLSNSTIQLPNSWVFSSDSSVGIHRLGSDKISFFTANLDRLVVDPSGNVGIGTSTPQGLFAVATSTNNSFLMVDSDTGNVGIGTSSPYTTLAINGNLGLSGNILEGTWQGSTIDVAYGGTGATTLNDGFVLLGSGTGAITPLDLTTQGSILVGDGTTDPVALPVGTAYQTLVASSTTATGLVWENKGGRYGMNVETLTGNKELNASKDAMYQYLDLNATVRFVYLATTTATAGDRFVIRSNGTYNEDEYLAVEEGDAAYNPNELDYIFAGGTKEFIFDGTNWISGETGSGENDNKKYNVALGYDSNAYGLGTAIGYNTDGYNYGVGVGGSAIGYNNGVAVGYNSSGNTYGAAVGRSADGDNYSAALGYYAGFWTNGAATAGNGSLFLGYKAGMAAVSDLKTNKLYIANDDIASGNTLIYGEFDNKLVGIATTSPYSSLTVWGNGTNPIFEAVDNASSTKMIILNNGNVGIGTTTPNNLLEVANLISFDDTLYNVKLGTNAGNSITDGTSNTFIGYDAGTTATTSDYNLFLGYNAGKLNTGNQNIAIGTDALDASGYGSYNVALGYSSLSANTSGSGNTAIGYRTLQTNITGTYNTAIGYYSLRNNTTGASNTAIGYNALDANTTGLYNSAVGNYALTSNINGNSNTAMGHYALRYNFSATSTVAIGKGAAKGAAAYHNESITVVGFRSGYKMTTGSDSNTFLGYQSGYENTTGANNLLLGFQAGNNITTGSNNIVIGYDIDAPLATGSNQLNIANAIYGNTSTGNIGIGTTSPWGILSVNAPGGTNPFVIGSSTATQFIVKESGNVGIGTSSPGAEFEISSSQPTLYFRETDSSKSFYMEETSGVFYLGSMNTSNAAADKLAFSASGSTGDVMFYQEVKLDTDTDKLWFGEDQDATIYYDGTDLQFNSQEVGTGDFIFNNGKVGIGTTSPYSLLSINAPGASTFLAIGSSTATRLQVDDTTFQIQEGAFTHTYSTGITSIDALEVGPMAFETDAGIVSWVDMTVDTTSAGLVQSYTAQLDGNSMLTLYGLTDGSGGVINRGVGIGTTSPIGLFAVGSSTVDTAFLMVNNDTGNVGIGTTSPYASLSVVKTSPAEGEIIFAIATTTAGSIFTVDEDGDIFYDGAASSPSADYAEYYYTVNTDLSSGEAVCVDITRENAVKRCGRASDGNIMGIVSTKPAIVGNSKRGYENNPNYVVVGMLGQVPAKVSQENGEIRPGDSLTSASIAGYLMKAGAGDPTVGIALEHLSSQEEVAMGVINVLISRRNKSITVAEVEEKVTERIANMEIEDEVNILIASAIDSLDLGDEIATAIDPKLLLLETKLTVQSDDLGERLVNVERDVNSVISALANLDLRITDINTNLINLTELTNVFEVGSDGNITVNTGGGVEILTATTTTKTAFVVNQESSKDVADFRTNNVSVMNISSEGKVSVVGNLLVDGRIMACSGGSCGDTLDNAVDETMGDIGVEGKVVAGAFEGYCDDGFVWVPGSSKYGTMPGFCVQANLANTNGTNLTNETNVDGQGEGEVWINVSQGEANLACQNIGSGYHLISENEWLTIAENVINTDLNNLNTNEDGLMLSNDNVIYDLVGVLSPSGDWIGEWTNMTITKKGVPEVGISSSENSEQGWYEYVDVIDYKGLDIAPAYYLTDVDNNIGKIKVGDSNTNLRGFVRGGSGIYSLDLSFAPNEVDENIGFRCAR